LVNPEKESNFREHHIYMPAIGIEIKLLAVLFFTVTLSACNKQKDPDSLEQGKNFNLLLKTITKDKSNNSVISEYSYNSNQQVSEIITDYAYSASAPVHQTQTFYRNKTGRLDSILFQGKTDGILNVTEKTYFTYDAGGMLILSMKGPDSSIYMYSGNILQRRIDYQKKYTGSYELLRQVNYEFDAAGNISKCIFQWTSNTSIDSFIFQYDNKINPIPAERLLFYFADVFYNDYNPTNNLTRVTNHGYGTNYFDYKYTPGNKPLYCKSQDIGTTDPAFFAETNYYYD